MKGNAWEVMVKFVNPFLEYFISLNFNCQY